jgi:hypothetical protein
MIYSPSLDIPMNPLSKNQVDLQGGVGLFPETRPHKIDDKNRTLGACGRLSFGVTNNLTLSAKAWSDIERLEEFRTGFALSGQIIRPLSHHSRLIFIPRLGIATSGPLGWGQGVGFSTVFQQEIVQHYGYYLGLGSVWGWVDKTSEGGIGLLAHIGFSRRLSDSFWLNFELNPVYQINYYDNKQPFLVSPTLSLGFRVN